MNRFFISLLILFPACQSPVPQPQATDPVINHSTRIDTSLYVKEDSIILRVAAFDTLTYNGDEFNELIDHFPDLYEPLPLSPDISYYQSGISKTITDKKGHPKVISFGSEQGQDSYYILYAYFLQRKDTDQDMKNRRTVLTSLYRKLNELFGRLTGGGTFFGHMYNRIPAYVEYSLHLYGSNKEFYTKEYAINRQKQLFINMLRQFITDELGVNYEHSPEDKEETRKILVTVVNDIESLITDFFFLSQAQEFRHANY